MSNAILAALKQWLSKSTITPPCWPSAHDTPLRTAIRRAFDAQTSIGWDQFFRGRLTIYWRRPLAMYYKERDIKLSTTLWMTKCIDSVWKLYNSMWDQRNEDLFGGTKDEVWLGSRSPYILYPYVDSVV
jgi:hypothetical protein